MRVWCQENAALFKITLKAGWATIVKSEHKGPKPFQRATVFQRKGAAPGRGRPLKDCALEFASRLQRDERRSVGDYDMVQQLDAKDLARVTEPFRDGYVVL